MSMARPPRRLSALGFTFLAAAACSGQMGGGSTDTDPDSDPMTAPDGKTPGKPQTGKDPGDPAPVGPVTGTPAGGTKPIVAPATDGAKTAGAFFAQRLTREELNNTVRDLLGDTTAPAKSWPPDVNGTSGFAVPGAAGGLEVGNYEEAARALAAKAVMKLSDLAPCEAGQSEEACAGAFVQKFGARAFRRPLDADEVTYFVDLYKKLRAAPISEAHAGAIEGVLQAFLQSPRFLYRWEDGVAAKADATGLQPLNPYALASRLSYLIWRSMPDEALFQSAKKGELADETKLAEHVARMLKDPRAAEATADFHRQWLQVSMIDTVSKSPTVYKSLTPELRESMRAELMAFVKDAVLGAGKLDALLLGTKTSVNEGLAAVYGVPGITGKALAPATLDPTKRAGVLTSAAFLTVNGTPFGSSPIKRGHVIRERFLCQVPQPPPPGVDSTPPPDDPAKTTREAVNDKTMTSDNCIGCHQLMNPLGYGLENYDGIGQYRADEKGKPVDATGMIAGVETPRSFKDGPSLAKALLETAEVQTCVATQWARFALGRAESTADAPSLDFIQAHFRAGALEFKSMLTAIVRSRAFRYQGAQ